MSAAEAAALDGDARPVVATGGSGKVGLWIFLAVVTIIGATVFAAMNAARIERDNPQSLTPPLDPTRQISSPPPLAFPEGYLETPVRPLPPAPSQNQPRQPPVLVRQVAPSAPTPVIQPVRQAPITQTVQVQPAEPPAPERRVVFETAATGLTPPPGLAASGDGSRVTAGYFANPARTVPQGTVIPAVLETALDSTRPGAARALVQRDIYGFDGTRILIPRGSRIYGEYAADLSPGQNRALIQWTRLIRPDGVTMALDSPSSDPLGRAGVRGKVDSKFFRRFGGALLQSVLDIGVGVATREASGNGVVVALPGSTQNLQIQQPGEIQPTLRVRHGTSVSVFVARDLDFSTVEF